MSKPLILVTNDDGIVAPGIRALVEVASTFGEVVVVAPNKPQSGQGHAITITKPLRLRKVPIFDGIVALECSGTPVDCVKLAKSIVLKDRKIDLCISGINHGSNASINIIYSGTMSAAMEASLSDIDSIGFSLLDYSNDADFSGAKKYASQIIQQVLEEKLQRCKLLNVNIPALPVSEIKGIKVCKQGKAMWDEGFSTAKDPRGGSYYWLTGKFNDLNITDTESDIWALKNGYVSVVPSWHDLTKVDAINTMKYLETT